MSNALSPCACCGCSCRRSCRPRGMSPHGDGKTGGRCSRPCGSFRGSRERRGGGGRDCPGDGPDPTDCACQSSSPGTRRLKTEVTDPEAPIKLDAGSKSALAASIRALAPGRRGWISMSEAAHLFSAKEAAYAFGELDDDGSRTLVLRRDDAEAPFRFHAGRGTSLLREQLKGVRATCPHALRWVSFSRRPPQAGGPAVCRLHANGRQPERRRWTAP